MIIENQKTKEISEFAIDGVFVAIGRRPDTGFLNGKINLDKGCKKILFSKLCERTYIYVYVKAQLLGVAGIFCGLLRQF